MDERDKKMPPFGGPQGGPPRGGRPKEERDLRESEKEEGTVDPTSGVNAPKEEI